MSVARAHPNAYKRLGSNSRAPPFPNSQYCDIPADFSKVDSILKHLQQTESHDWLGEITHCCTQVCYLLLQNYNISRFNFYNYNCHLIVLTTLFFTQRIWCFLWRVTQFSDAHGLRFACHIVLFLVLLDALYCGMQLVLKDSFVGSLYLATPLLSSVLFYHVYLKYNTNVFTSELFSMLSRCVYHSLEAAYCIGVLPLKFLQYEYIYFDTSRCMVLTALVTVHIFLSLFCLELHCLGSEVLQQTRMLGEWRCIPKSSQRYKSIRDEEIKRAIKEEENKTHGKHAATKSAYSEWSYLNCPYPRGAVVQVAASGDDRRKPKDQQPNYYEAMATLNTCTPTSPSQFIYPIAFVLGDYQRTKAVTLAALLLLNAALVHLILWSNQWSMYAVMLIPNCGHFLYVKFRRSHAFFNPAHLNLRQLQWDLNIDMPGSKLNGTGGHKDLSNNHGGSRAPGVAQYEGGWGSYPDGVTEEDDISNHPDDVMGDGAYGANHDNGLADAGFTTSLNSPNPLFMSAVSASTMFFFGPSGQENEMQNAGLVRQEGGRNDM